MLRVPRHLSADTDQKTGAQSHQERPADFFQILYGDQPPGRLVLWTRQDKRSYYFPALDHHQSGRKAEDLAIQKDVYFGVGLQTEERGATQRGTAAGVCAIPGVWSDVDVKGPAHKDPRLPPTMMAALVLVHKFPLPPTLIIESGHGVQVYWLFTKLWVFQDEEERLHAQRLVQRFQATLQAEARADGWTLDSTHDLARVLRVPGTFNRKLEPVPVTVMEVNPACRYDRADVERHLLPESPSPKRRLKPPGKRERHPKPPDHGPRADASLIVQECAWFRHCRDDAQTLSEPKWYASLSILGHCENGEALAHEWSRVYSGYTAEETDAKLTHALEDAGPRTCQNIRQTLDGEQYCAKCPHWENITSPLELGNPRLLPKGASLALAKRTLLNLYDLIQKDPAGFIQQILETPRSIDALARLAEYDRAAYEAGLDKLRKYGLKDRELKALERAVNGALRSLRHPQLIGPEEESLPLPVCEVLPDAPVTASAVVPRRWSLSQSGLAVEKIRTGNFGERFPILSPVASAPVLMTGRFKNVADGSESVQLTWLRDGRWQSHIVGRETVAQEKQLVQLAKMGLPVNSGNAKAVVQYLADYEAINLPILPCATVSARLGWQGPEGRLGFLLGKTFITPTGEQVEAELSPDIMAPSEGGDHRIVFQGADGGDDQFVQGFHAAGTYDAWLQTVQRVVPYPRALQAIYVALTPPLLMILDTSNFCLDLCGPTSLGKTTVLRLAASCWGCPDERLATSVLRTWDLTRVWAEQASTVLHALPLILDDTKRAREPDFVAQVLYDVTSGQGRGRGSILGLRRSGEWKTVLLSSGEAPAVSFTQEGGTRARVLTLWGSPFGTADKTTAEAVQAIQQGILQNYGHLGPRFVQELLKVRDQWDTLREVYGMAHQQYLQRGEGNPVVGRMAAYFAALTLTAMFAHEFLELPWDYQDLIDVLWDDLTTEASEADRAARALAAVMSWAHGNKHAFWGRHEYDHRGDPKAPPQGWAGQWACGESWSYIAFFPHHLDALLSKFEFEAEAIIRTWRDREWLITGSDRKRNHAQVRINGEKTYMVVIKRTAITEAEAK